MEKIQLTALALHLLDLPEKIKKTQLLTIERNQNLHELETSLASLEGAIRLKINEKVDTNGKKVYSNAEAREIAFLEATQFDTEIKDLRDKVLALQNEIQSLKVEYEAVSNEQRNIRSVLHFFAESSESA